MQINILRTRDADERFSFTKAHLRSGKCYFSDREHPHNFHHPAEGSPRMHAHAYYEFVYVASGEMTQHFPNGTFHYQAGDALLLNRNMQHMEGWETDCDILFLCMSREFLLQTLTGNPVYLGKTQHASPQILSFLVNEEASAQEYLDFACALEQRAKTAPSDMDRLLADMVRQLEQPGIGYAYHVQAELLSLLALLENPKRYLLSRIRIDSSSENFAYMRVLRYLTERHGHASREELGTALHYNGDYLNQLIKRQCGLTIRQLGMEISLRQVREQLLETTLPIGAILEAHGIVNRTHFNQQFKKKYGMLPLEYRSRQHKSAKPWEDQP